MRIRRSPARLACRCTQDAIKTRHLSSVNLPMR
jgi:hypothetical protein